MGNTTRLEVLEGPTGRRAWPDDVKGRIVAESFEPGARVADVARRHGMAAQHLSTWRRLARDGKIVVPVYEPMFARLEVAPQDEAVPEPPTDGLVEIDMGGITIRFSGGCTAGRIADVVSALSIGR
ncbi:MAG: transposase [Roseicyclus sp.]|nr:transposase [Roseicyclus sp.]